MLKYIYQDLVSVVEFLPGGVAMGAVFSVAFFWAAGKRRKRRGEERAAMLPGALFWIYVSVMLIITFFPGMSGSRQGMDLGAFFYLGDQREEQCLCGGKCPSVHSLWLLCHGHSSH